MREQGEHRQGWSRHRVVQFDVWCEAGASSRLVPARCADRLREVEAPLDWLRAGMQAAWLQKQQPSSLCRSAGCQDSPAGPTHHSMHGGLST